MSKYKLEDFTYNIGTNSWSRVPRDPISFLTTAWNSLPPLAAKILLSIGASIVAGYLLKKLGGDRDTRGDRELFANIRDPSAPHDIVYGEVRKGGVITHLESTSNNNFLHYFLVLAGHEIESVEKIYINDEDHTSNWTRSTGLVNGTTDTEVDWKNKLRIYSHLGGQTLASDTFESSTATLASTYHSESESSDVDQYFVGKGLSYLYIRMEYDKDVFADGIPNFTAVVRGKKVQNENGVAQTFPASSNAAYVLRDYLISDYGVGDSADNIDSSSFASAAAVCNTNSGSGGDNKLFVNGVLRTNRSRIDNLEEITAAMGGALFWGSGKWKVKAPVFSTSVKTLSLSDLRSGIEIDTRHSARDNFNAVQGIFNDKDQDWVEADYPEVTSSVYQTEDGGQKSILDFNLDLVTNSVQAQRLAKMTLNRHREQIGFQANFGLAAFDLEVGDVIKFNDYNEETNSYRYGFYSATPADQKTFEVIGWKFSNSSDGDLVVSLQLQEISSSVFSWDADEQAIVSNNTTLGRTVTNLDPSNVVIADTGYTATDGTFVPQLDVSWTAATNNLVQYYEVQWREVNETSYFSSTVNGTSVLLGPVATGAVYEVRVRGVANSGATSPYVSPATHTVGGDTLSPSPVTGLTATSGFQQVTLDWTAPTTNTDTTTLYDLQGYYIYRRTANSQPTDPIAFFNGDRYVDGGLEVNTTYYYWIEAVDYSGNKSTAVASGAITTSDISLDGPQFVRVLYYDDRATITDGTSFTLSSTVGGTDGSYMFATITGSNDFSFDSSTSVLSSTGTISSSSATATNSEILVIKTPDEDSNALNTTSAYEQLDRLTVGSEIQLKDENGNLTVYDVDQVSLPYVDGATRIYAIGIAHKTGVTTALPSASDGTNVEFTLNYHLKGDDGVTGTNYKQIRMYQSATSQPSAPSNTAFDTSTGEPTSNNGWTPTISTIATGEKLYVAEFFIKQVDGSSTWEADSSNWNISLISEAASNYKTVKLYQYTSSNSAPSAPATNQGFSTSNGDATNTGNWVTTSSGTSNRYLWSAELVIVQEQGTGNWSAESSSWNVVLVSFSADDKKIIRLYQNATSTPTAPSYTSGFNSSTGTAQSTGNWAVSASTPSLGQSIYVAEMTIFKANGASSWTSDSNEPWVVNPAGATGATGADGADGTNGTDAPRFAEITLYRLSSTQPSAPSATITWSSGSISGITSGWSRTAPTQVATSDQLVWSSYVVFIDTTPPYSSTTATGATPSQGINFSGLVTFTGGDFAVGGSTITNIDGGNITTGSIKADAVDIDETISLTGATAGFVGGRTGTSDFGTDGFYVGRTSTSGNVADGFQLSHTSLTTANHPLLNSGTVQGVIHDDVQGLRIYEPIFYKRGSGTGSDITINAPSNTAATLAKGQVHTITLIGGGGGGGGGATGDVNNANSANLPTDGNAGGTTSLTINGATGYNGTRTFNAAGGAGGAKGYNTNERANDGNSNVRPGNAGQTSVYGVGGAGSNGGSYNAGHNFPGGTATSRGAGGGGGSGWQSDNLTGNGGDGGSAAQLVTVTIDLTNANNNGTVDVNAIGAGGNGGVYANSNSTRRSNSGGSGAAGRVEVSGVLDGYNAVSLNQLDPPIFHGSTPTQEGTTGGTILAGGTNGKWFSGQFNSGGTGTTYTVNGANTWIHFTGGYKPTVRGTFSFTSPYFRGVNSNTFNISNPRDGNIYTNGRVQCYGYLDGNITPSINNSGFNGLTWTA